MPSFSKLLLNEWVWFRTTEPSVKYVTVEIWLYSVTAFTFYSTNKTVQIKFNVHDMTSTFISLLSIVSIHGLAFHMIMYSVI